MGEKPTKISTGHSTYHLNESGQYVSEAGYLPPQEEQHALDVHHYTTMMAMKDEERERLCKERDEAVLYKKKNGKYPENYDPKKMETAIKGIDEEQNNLKDVFWPGQKTPNESAHNGSSEKASPKNQQDIKTVFWNEPMKEKLAAGGITVAILAGIFGIVSISNNDASAPKRDSVEQSGEALRTAQPKLLPPFHTQPVKPFENGFYRPSHDLVNMWQGPLDRPTHIATFGRSACFHVTDADFSSSFAIATTQSRTMEKTREYTGYVLKSQLERVDLCPASPSVPGQQTQAPVGKPGEFPGFHIMSHTMLYNQIGSGQQPVEQLPDRTCVIVDAVDPETQTWSHVTAVKGGQRVSGWAFDLRLDYQHRCQL